MKKKFIASVLVLAMVVSSLAGCGKKDANTSGGKSSKKDTLVISSEDFSNKFSTFFAESSADINIVSLVNSSLFPLDREGNTLQNSTKGETVAYDGKNYTYEGIADLTVTRNPSTTVYNIKMRDDIVFSDGEKANIDDVIFAMYVLADPKYSGSSTFASTPIVGMQNYRYNSTLTTSVKDEDVVKWLAANGTNAKLLEKIKELMKAALQTEYADCEFVMQDENKETYKAVIGTAKTPVELMVNLYDTGKKLDATKLTADTVVDEVLNLYGTDYKKLSKCLALEGDGTDTFFDASIQEEAKKIYIEESLAAGKGKEVPNIEGIKKINDYELEITTEGYEASTIEKINVSLTPLHYYGDKSQYDYQNNKFGFTRGNLDSIDEKTEKPLGSGAYVFKECKNKIVYLESNPKYYKGEPKIKNLQVKVTANADNIPGVQKGTIDMAEISGSKTNFEQIKGLNSNGKETGNVITTTKTQFLGYGYIGMCANNIKVGKDGSSDASKAFRKGIATILAAYREVAIDSYYGDAATIIQYPISNTSWAAPKPSDAGYTNAFSTDVNGKPIYTDNMKAEDKYIAASKAALGFFQKAGCTISGGKVVKAPVGTSLKIEAMIGADGTGDHPSFAILTDAKSALSKLGIELAINDLSNPATMWDKLKKGQGEIFVAAWGATPDPDMYQVYHSSQTEAGSNHYRIADKMLDDLIVKARKSDNKEYRKATYKKCLDIIMDWAVEVPVYQRENAIIFSSERIKNNTIPTTLTPFYKWYEEIHNIEMK